MSFYNIQAPLFHSAYVQADQTSGGEVTLNLDEIFGDCFFTPDGNTIFLSETNDPDALLTSGESHPAPVASRPLPSQQETFVPFSQGGGIATTGLQNPNALSTVMGRPLDTHFTAGNASAQYLAQPPQQRHHLQFATSAYPLTKRKNMSLSAAARERRMSDQQKSERRYDSVFLKPIDICTFNMLVVQLMAYPLDGSSFSRERNREHAKRSRIRKKFLLESLQTSVSSLKDENEKLRSSLRHHLGGPAENLLTDDHLKTVIADGGIIAKTRSEATKALDDPDFSFIKALQNAQQNFIVTDPSLPDNPIVYATIGFLNLTGYTLDQVLGRNCRFLQGPETNPKAVAKIRKAIEDGTDMSVCLLNYRVDGTTFWNQFFIAALRDTAGNVTNYVGVQCKVSDQYAAMECKKQEEEDAKMSGGEYEDDEEDDEDDDEEDDDE